MARGFSKLDLRFPGGQLKSVCIRQIVWQHRSTGMGTLRHVSQTNQGDQVAEDLDMQPKFALSGPLSSLRCGPCRAPMAL